MRGFQPRAPVVNPKDSGPRWCEGEEATCHPHRALAPNKHPGDFRLYCMQRLMSYWALSCTICLIHLFLIYLIQFDVYVIINKYTHIFSLYVHTSDTCLYSQRWMNKKNIHSKSSTTTSIVVKRRSGHGYPCCVSTYDIPPHHTPFIELHTAKQRFFAP